MLKRLVLDVYERDDISLLKFTLLIKTAPHLHKFLSLVKGLTSQLPIYKSKATESYCRSRKTCYQTKECQQKGVESGLALLGQPKNKDQSCSKLKPGTKCHQAQSTPAGVTVVAATLILSYQNGVLGQNMREVCQNAPNT